MGLGIFISNKLREKGVTLYFLSKSTGISYPYLLAIEKGKRNNPSYEKLKKIAAVLEVDVQELLEAAGMEEPSAVPMVGKTVSDHLATRVPVLGWHVLSELTDVARLKDRVFRQFRTTDLKAKDLYALDCPKGLDGFFSPGTTLILQVCSKPVEQQLVLVKNASGIGVYRVRMLGKKLLAVPMDELKSLLWISDVLDAAGVMFVIRESVLRW